MLTLKNLSLTAADAQTRGHCQKTFPGREDEKFPCHCRPETAAAS